MVVSFIVIAQSYLKGTDMRHMPKPQRILQQSFAGGARDVCGIYTHPPLLVVLLGSYVPAS